jgi:hypothetical protein
VSRIVQEFPLSWCLLRFQNKPNPRPVKEVADIVFGSEHAVWSSGRLESIWFVRIS